MAEGRELGFVQFSRTSRPMVSMVEKSRAHRTINDAPLPKVKWYLSHICFLHPFQFPFTSFVFPTACLKFSKLFSACWNFSSTFPFLQKYQKYFLSFKIFLENILNIIFEQNLAEHPWSSSIWLLELNSQRGTAAGPPGGRPNPQVSRTLVAIVQAPLAPTVTWPLWPASLRVPSLILFK